MTAPRAQYWVLCVAPQRAQGWQPSWKTGSLALVVVASLVAPSLLFALLLSHWQYRHLVSYPGNSLPTVLTSGFAYLLLAV